MGNSVAGFGRKRVKVMKINGETMKLRVPLRARDVTEDHPGHVLLDSEAVKLFGIRAKPLEPQQDLTPKRVYFLIELPRFADHHDRRLSSTRVRSGISMSAKDRLECLALSRRSVSDLSSVRQPSSGLDSGVPARPSTGPVSVRVRLPKAQVAKLVEESKDEAEVAEKIVGIYMRSNSVVGDVDDVARVGEREAGQLRREKWKFGGDSVAADYKAREKRVSFLQIEEGEIRLAVDTLS